MFNRLCSHYVNLLMVVRGQCSDRSPLSKLILLASYRSCLKVGGARSLGQSLTRPSLSLRLFERIKSNTKVLGNSLYHLGFFWCSYPI